MKTFDELFNGFVGLAIWGALAFAVFAIFWVLSFVAVFVGL